MEEDIASSQSTWQFKSLIIVMLLGAALRLYHLGFNPIWLDEASTITFSVGSLPSIWSSMVGGEFNPPLFYWIEHVMLSAGNSEIVLRFVPALAGILTIPLIFLAGKEFLDETVGIIAAAISAISPFLIYYSQEARAYSLMVFFVAAVSLYYFRALKENDILNWALFGIFSALAFWTHFYALVVIAAYVLYALYARSETLKTDIQTSFPMGVGFILFGFLSIPLIMVMIDLFTKKTASMQTYGVQGLQVVTDTIIQLSGFQLSGSWPGWIILTILFVVGVIQAFLLDKKKGVFLVFIPVFVLVTSVFLSRSIPMLPRYMIFLVVPYFIGIALSYRFIETMIPLGFYSSTFKAFAIIFVISLLVFSPYLSVYYVGYAKDDWKGTAKAIMSLTKDGDTVIVIPGCNSQPFNYYYSNRTDHTMEYLTTDGEDLYWMSVPRSWNSTVFYIITPDIYAANPQGNTLNWINTHTIKLVQRGNIYIMWSR